MNVVAHEGADIGSSVPAASGEVILQAMPDNCVLFHNTTACSFTIQLLWFHVDVGQRL
jgi:hypothetical protein